MPVSKRRKHKSGKPVKLKTNPAEVLAELAIKANSDSDSCIQHFAKLDLRVAQALAIGNDYLLAEACSMLDPDDCDFLNRHIELSSESVSFDDYETIGQLFCVPLLIVSEKEPPLQIAEDEVCNTLATSFRRHGLITARPSIIIGRDLLSADLLGSLSWSEVIAKLTVPFSKTVASDFISPAPTLFSEKELQEFKSETCESTVYLRYIVGMVVFEEEEEVLWRRLDEDPSVEDTLDNWSSEVESLLTTDLASTTIMVANPETFYDGVSSGILSILGIGASQELQQIAHTTGYLTPAMQGYASIHKMEDCLQVRVGIVDKLEQNTLGSVLVSLPLSISATQMMDMATFIIDGLEISLDKIVLVAGSHTEDLCECCKKPLFFVGPNKQETVEAETAMHETANSGSAGHLLH